MSHTDDQRRMIAHMESMKKLKSGAMSKFLYHGIEHFLLEHGTWYEPHPFDEERYERGIPKSCFRNALMLSVTEGLRYVEGLAVSKKLLSVMFPVHHAWNLDEQGRVIDSTWPDAGALYYGVEFSIRHAEKSLSSAGTVLDDYQHGHPLFRKPWRGR